MESDLNVFKMNLLSYLVCRFFTFESSSFRIDVLNSGIYIFIFIYFPLLVLKVVEYVWVGNTMVD